MLEACLDHPVCRHLPSITLGVALLLGVLFVALAILDMRRSKGRRSTL